VRLARFGLSLLRERRSSGKLKEKQSGPIRATSVYSPQPSNHAVLPVRAVSASSTFCQQLLFFFLHAHDGDFGEAFIE
jgi:hypothetical protein